MHASAIRIRPAQPGVIQMSASRYLSICLFVLVMTGCVGSGAPARPEGVTVSGKIILPNGSPLTGGTLILRPDAGLFGATALVQSDGSFTLQDTSGTPTVVTGKYQVFVSFPNPNHASLRKSVATRYQESDDGDSDLFVDIQHPSEELIIQLKR